MRKRAHLEDNKDTTVVIEMVYSGTFNDCSYILIMLDREGMHQIQGGLTGLTKNLN